MTINDSLNYSASVDYSQWFSTIMMVLEIVGMWLYFKKAGEAGWKALIPFYSTYIDCTVAKRKDAFMMKLFAIILTALGTVLIIVGFIFTMAGVNYVNMMMAGTVIFCIALALGLVSGWKIAKGLAENFGLQKAFAVGLLLLPGIFRFILGVGKYTYKEDTIIDVQAVENEEQKDDLSE